MSRTECLKKMQTQCMYETNMNVKSEMLLGDKTYSFTLINFVAFKLLKILKTVCIKVSQGWTCVDNNCNYGSFILEFFLLKMAVMLTNVLWTPNDMYLETRLN